MALLGGLSWQSSAPAAITYTFAYPDNAGDEGWNNANNWTSDPNTPGGIPGSELPGGAGETSDDIVIIGSRSAGGNLNINLNNTNAGTIATLTLGAGHTTNNTDARPQLRIYGGTNAQLVITGDLILGGVGGSNGTTQFQGDLQVGNGTGTGGRGRLTVSGDINSASTGDHDITINAGGSADAGAGIDTWGMTFGGNIDAGLEELGAHEIDLTINRGYFDWTNLSGIAYVEDFNVVDIGNQNLVNTTWELKDGQKIVASARSDVGRNSSNATQTGISIGTFDLNGTFTANATGTNAFVI
ncbi:MAG: hypothetical protein ACOY3P_00155, partial [Planctomycetota bacterium]